MRARHPLYVMAKPPPGIAALPRNDPARGPHLLHVTLATLFDLHRGPIGGIGKATHVEHRRRRLHPVAAVAKAGA